MNIIYDAMKKFENSYPTNDRGKINKKDKNRVKIYLIFGLMVCLGFLVTDIFFNSLLKKSQINTDLVKNQLEVKQRQDVNSNPELPVKEEVPLENISPQFSTTQKQGSLFILSGVVYSGDEGYALVNNSIVKEGDVIDGAIIKQITSDKVTLEKDGVYQDLTPGTSGYISSQAPLEEIEERKETGVVQAVKTEIYPQTKVEKEPQQKTKEKIPVKITEEEIVSGNRGYITESDTSEIVGPQELSTIASMVKVERYTVQSGDTLQKISNKFYGTISKWSKIYEANKAKLKAPDRIYSGQVIDIPIEP